METYVPTTKYKTILIIESNIAFSERLSIALTKEGYRTILVKNGSQGFASILSNKCDLIILDIVLSGTDGYEILQKKEANPEVASIPVFLLSIQGIPINMRLIPQGSVAEFSASAHPDLADIISRVNRYFGFTHNSKSPAPEASTQPVVEKSSKKKILWVEDDKLIGTILGKKITASGFDLIHATNGSDAIKASKDVVPDAIILDLMLPGMNGFEILQKFRLDKRLSKVPVMILSNLSKPSDIEKAKMLGVKKFFVKAALSLDQIIIEITQLLE